MQVQLSKIHKVDTGNFNLSDDLLAVEEPLEIRLSWGSLDNWNEQGVSVAMRTPGDDLDLARGFLFSEGILEKPDDLKTVRHCSTENTVVVELKEGVAVDLEKIKRHFISHSSCGICGKTSIESIRKSIPKNSSLAPAFPAVDAIPLIEKIADDFTVHQKLFQSTGGLHASALYSVQGHLIKLFEDVGRHNALDKVIGYSFRQGLLPLNQSILMLSGRVSFELVQKSAMAGLRVLLAVGAPSSLAVSLAQEFDITLVGFLKQKKFNIYSGRRKLGL